MGDDTNIGWTDSTWNPTRGCTRVSEGCRNCYAESVANRFSGEGQPYEGLTQLSRSGRPRWTGKVIVAPKAVDQPLRWVRPRMIFVNSMSDLFHEQIPDSFLRLVFSIMVTAHHMRGHVFQVLTKRPKRMMEFVNSLRWADGIVPMEISGRKHLLLRVAAPNDMELPDNHETGCPDGIWLGTSVENQNAAEERIPWLLRTNVSTRFLSIEPQLEEVDLSDVSGENVLDPECWGDCKCDDLWGPEPGCRRNGGDGTLTRKVSWVISGGESGRSARPFQLGWGRLLAEQCAEAGVPFFFKQAGTLPMEGPTRVLFKAKKGEDPEEWPAELRHQAFPEVPSPKAITGLHAKG